MSLLEIEEKHIQPLTRAEKEQLIEDVQRMLQEEELREMGIYPGVVCEISTPNIFLDEHAEAQASTALEHLLKEEGVAG